MPFSVIENVPIFPGCEKEIMKRNENVCPKRSQNLFKESLILI